MTAPSRRRRPAPRAAGAPSDAARLLAAPLGLVAVLLVAGCTTVGGGPAAGEGEAPAGDATAPAATPADSAREGAGSAGDSVRVRAAAADSAYLALLDSARVLAGSGGEPAATPRPDTAGAGEEDGEGADDDYPAGPVTVTDVGQLRELGPVYTPYAIGPSLSMPQERLDGLLKATLVPVIRRYELAPDEWARYWVLVDGHGAVQATRLQLPSGHTAFDEAARAVAENLQFVPAERDGEAVPVWILARISLLMR